MNTKIELELTKTLEEHDDQLVVGSALPTEDLSAQYRHLFNADALTILDKPLSRTLLRQHPGSMDYDMGQNFVIRCIGKDNIPKAVEKLAEVLNHLSSLGHIRSYLARPSYLALANISFEPQTESNRDYLVYTFPLFTPEGTLALQELKYGFHMLEGQMPSLESAIGYISPSPSLPGIAYHYHCHSAGSFPSDLDTFQTRLEKRKELLLSVLPKGTEIIAVDERNEIIGLSRDFRFTLKHPFFEPGMTIEIDYSRICWRNDENGVDQESLLTGIRYLKADGSNAF